MALLPATKITIAAIVTELGTIVDIGKVVNGRRDKVNPAEYDALYIDAGGSDTVRAWIVDVTSMNSQEDDAGCLFISPRSITIDGFVIFNPEGGSHDTFRDLVDAVVSKINGNVAIFGAAPLREDVGSTAVYDFAFLGDKFCHHVAIEVLVEAEETK